MTESTQPNPAVAEARARRVPGPEEVVTTQAGVRVRLRRVAPSLVAAVQARVPVPAVPEWYNAAKDRYEPNPSDPGYLAALERATLERNVAALDAIIMFGLELVDGVPAEAAWLRKLALLGLAVDEADPLAVEFAYKRYVALSADDLAELGALAAGNASAAEVAAARGTF